MICQLSLIIIKHHLAGNYVLGSILEMILNNITELSLSNNLVIYQIYFKLFRMKEVRFLKVRSPPRKKICLKV